MLEFPGTSAGKKSACNAGNTGDMSLIPGWEDPLEKEMANYSNILAWEIPWTEKTGGLRPYSHKRVRHNLGTKQQPLKLL